MLIKCKYTYSDEMVVCVMCTGWDLGKGGVKVRGGG